MAKSFSVLSQIHVKRFAMRTWTFRAAHRTEARGSVCALKDATLIGATDQRTTSGPADPILRARGRRHDRTRDQRNAENNP
jgi:hypothetical protein